MFLVLVEAIAAFVIVRSTLNDVLNTILIVFLVVFPCMVLFVFYMLVTKHHEKLYSPSDYEDETNFVSTYDRATREYRLTKRHASENAISIAQLKESTSDGGYAVIVNADHITDSNSADGNEAIWLGCNVPLEIAREMIIAAKSVFPHLKYIEISDVNPWDTHNEIYIGGSTKTAKENRLKELNQSDFEKLCSLTNLEQLHHFIREFAPKKAK